MTKLDELRLLGAKLKAEVENFRTAYSRYAAVAQDQAAYRQELINLRKERSKAALEAELGDEVDERAARDRDKRIAHLERVTAEGALEAAAEIVEERRNRAYTTWSEVSITFTPLIQQFREEYERRLRELAPEIAQIEANLRALKTNPSAVEIDFRLPSAIGHGNLLRAIPTPRPALPAELVEVLDLWQRVERTLDRPMR